MVRTGSEFQSEAGGLIRVSRILHAGYVFESEDTRIAFDPLFENPFSLNCFAYPSVAFDIKSIKEQQFSAVFISHYHDDHCSMDSLALLDRKTPIYVFCQHDELFVWIRQLGFTEVHVLALNQVVEVGAIRVTPRRALDFEVDSIFHIQAEGLNILNVVDSWIDADTFELLQQTRVWDLVLWPFQCMREVEVLSPIRSSKEKVDVPYEWIEQLQLLRPRAVVPSSCQFIHEPWSWYNFSLFSISYAQFMSEIEIALPSALQFRLNPGQSLFLKVGLIERAEPLSWIKPQGDQNVDYHFRPDLPAPSTGDIAKHFPALEPFQKTRIQKYCETELSQIYASLQTRGAEVADSYFDESRLWRLRLYEASGMMMEYLYKIEGSELCRVYALDGEELSWTTDVPAVKLYSALEEGESLTSMYVRINDQFFSPRIEKSLGNVDLLEDPLVRCLFSGVFGGYQKAQLREHLETGAPQWCQPSGFES